LLAMMNVIVYLTTNYDNVIIGVICPPEIVGFTFAAEGLFLQVVGFIPVGISQLDIPAWGFTTMLFSYCFALIVYHVYLTRLHRNDLMGLDDTTKNRGDRGCVERTVLGYT